jgi:outer membrane protein TolC
MNLSTASLPACSLFSIATLAPVALSMGRSYAATQASSPTHLSAVELSAMELSLEGAQALALEKNLGLQIEALATEAALFRFRATGGQFDWTASLNAGITDQQIQPGDLFSASDRNTQELTLGFNRPLTTGGTFSATFNTNNQVTNSPFAVDPTSTTDFVTLGYTQPLLRGAWRDYATSRQKEGEYDWQRQGERERQARQKLLLDVSNAYWDLVAAKAELGVAESGVDLARKQVDQNQKRLDAGLGVQNDVLQAETELAQREQERLLADTRLRAASDALKQLLFPGSDREAWARDLAPSTALPELVEGLYVPEWQAALTTAIDRRPELKQQRIGIDSAEVRLRRADSDKLPQLDMDVSAASQGYSIYSQEAFETATSYDYPTLRGFLTFSVPIGNTTARFQRKAAWTDLRAEKLRYDQLETTILADVRDAVRQAQYQIEAVKAAKKSLELAREQLEAEKARYDADQSTTFQVLQFQQEYVRSLSAEVLTRANLAKSRARLEAAQGTIGETKAP